MTVASKNDFQELQAATSRIWEIAQGFGLDPFATHFELVPATIMYEFGAYGIPGRFSHWSHGKAYQQMKTMYDFGLSKIYELVINSDPAYAFLLEGNDVLQNKLVAAHVLAHVDFFKHNIYFSHTHRQMVELAAISADRIRSHEFKHGRREVEQFLDAVLAIQEHIDTTMFLKPDEETDEEARKPARSEGPYDDLLLLGERRIEEPGRKPKFPKEPQKDLLKFLMEHSPHLEDWQRDIVGIIRGEMRYFLPQMQTKIMNEGWASYWHARILRELELSEDEYVAFANLNASVIAPSRRSLNPYFVGLKIFEDIERRWDDPTPEERKKLHRQPGQGRAKIFEVREVENDMAFLRNYLTKDLVDELDLYIYRREGDQWVIVEKDWEKVRDTIISSMTNFGHPYIVIEDADFRRNRELYLRHCYDGQALDIPYAEKTLRKVYQLWGRPVYLETQIDNEKTILKFDGESNTTSKTA